MSIDKPSHHREQCALTCPIGANEGGEAVGLDGERNVVYNGLSSLVFVCITDGDHAFPLEMSN
ncbi:MAG: hypothetical protein VB127_01890, partial [Sphaerochaeta sp.]|nr:hypothetical protein [Sphaerochaeta sp.]